MPLKIKIVPLQPRSGDERSEGAATRLSLDAGESNQTSTSLPQHEPLTDYRLVDMKQIATVLVEESYRSLQELCIRLEGGNVDDAERKRRTLRYFCEIRQRLLRLLALAMWHTVEGKKVPVLEQCLVLLQKCDNYHLNLRTASDNLAFLHDELRGMIQPRYDVATATGLMCFGRSPKLPLAVEEAAGATVEGGGGRAEALARLSARLRRILMVRVGQGSLEGAQISVAEGRARVSLADVFHLSVSIDPCSLSPGSGQAREDVHWLLQDVQVVMSSCHRSKVMMDEFLPPLKYQLQALLSSQQDAGLDSAVNCLRDFCSKLALHEASVQAHQLVSPGGKLHDTAELEGSSHAGMLKVYYWPTSAHSPVDRARAPHLLLRLHNSRLQCFNVLGTGAAERQTSRESGEVALRFCTKPIDMETTVSSAIRQASHMVLRSIAQDLTTRGALASAGGRVKLLVSEEVWPKLVFSAGTMDVFEMCVHRQLGSLAISGSDAEGLGPQAQGAMEAFAERALPKAGSAMDLVGVAGAMRLKALGDELSGLCSQVHCFTTLDRLSSAAGLYGLQAAPGYSNISLSNRGPKPSHSEMAVLRASKEGSLAAIVANSATQTAEGLALRCVDGPEGPRLLVSAACNPFPLTARPRLTRAASKKRKLSQGDEGGHVSLDEYLKDLSRLVKESGQKV